ncbi:MAG: dihydroorotate dehydrogenase [Planctomycetaceae bacterium]|jgi:dihydroorotate dehydrogenase (NAD+) catalytic subunit|nr:dihydroorotate dehydrogenase [Planctomycetaceae bacterium]
MLQKLPFNNPVLTASGTFGYACEMSGVFDLSRLGGIIPKTITLSSRSGNPAPRTFETASGLLNSIGLDNDGVDDFIEVKLPYLRTLGTKIIVSTAVKNLDECAALGEKLQAAEGIDAVELNVSCPNVSGGVDFAADSKLCERVVAAFCRNIKLPLFVKLSPNVFNIGEVAKGAESGGASGISAVNTCLGLAIDWRRRLPRLGNFFGGLSGPAIKPIALRCVYQIFRAIKIPVIGIGGISTIDDAMEFFVAGASAIQIGTANFYNPKAAIQILDALPAALSELGAKNVAEIVGTLETIQNHQ